MEQQNTLDTVDPKYQQTLIYGIVCLITKEKYVGSTYHTLEERIAVHIKDRDCSAWQILQRGNYKAYVIQHYPCNTKRERLTREGAWQRAYKKSFGDSLVNERIEGAFWMDNPEVRRMYNKQYHEEHKEEENARCRQYYVEHSDERKAYVKKYYEGHKEERKVYNKKYYDGHREEGKAYRSQPWTCEWCGKTMNTSSRGRHKKTWCKFKPNVHEAQKGC